MARPAATDQATARVLVELRRLGLLLQAGTEFTSVAQLVVGEEIRGSWWAHPQANLIYWVCQDLEAHPEVAHARLIAGKVTHLWRSVWADVAAIALAREPWQWRSVEPELRRLVALVDSAPQRTDTLSWQGQRRLGDACRLLERRLLVKADEIHTESGRHAKLLTAWRHWWDAHAAGPLPAAAAARSHLEARLDTAARHLPWCAGAATRIKH